MGGGGVMTCVMDRLRKQLLYKNDLDNIFEFFEEMANDSDEIKELLIYSTLEKLGDDKETFEIASCFMGKRTRILSM